jgi:hypothetical protein
MHHCVVDDSAALDFRMSMISVMLEMSVMSVIAVVTGTHNILISVMSVSIFDVCDDFFDACGPFNTVNDNEESKSAMSVVVQNPSLC